jgi:hypothetical protein
MVVIERRSWRGLHPFVQVEKRDAGERGGSFRSWQLGV